jgi:hypothetical protein
MSVEIMIRDAVKAAVLQSIQTELVPLLQPVIERLKLTPLRPSKVEDDPLMTTREVAAFLKLSPVTVEMWRPEGRGPSFVRINNTVRYRRSIVEAFAKANEGLLGRRGRPPVERVEEVKRSGLVVDGGHSRAGKERRAVVIRGEGK